MSVVNIGSGAVVGLLVETVAVLAPAATVVLDASLAGVYKLTPAQAEAVNATNVVEGSAITLVVISSGVASFTVTFGTNFKTTGTLATGTVDAKTFVLKFVGVGTNLVEVSRTVAQ